MGGKHVRETGGRQNGGWSKGRRTDSRIRGLNSLLDRKEGECHRSALATRAAEPRAENRPFRDCQRKQISQLSRGDLSVLQAPHARGEHELREAQAADEHTAPSPALLSSPWDRSDDFPKSPTVTSSFNAFGD